MKRIIKVLGIFLLIIFVIGIFIKKRINDKTLAVYVNDELQSSIPKKGKALFKKAICDNDVKVSWDDDTWSLKVSNLKIKTKCNLYFYEGQTVFNFDYTGNEQTFTAPFSGTYKLETWGAQGGGTTGGVGSCSSGLISLNKNDILYINIGGTAQGNSGGYNGGGNGVNGGGGATHISTKSGLLSTLSNYLDSILIVSGAGGGKGKSGYGGIAGGYVGSKGESIYCSDNEEKCGYGGTQSAGGMAASNTWAENGSFGQGGNYKIGSSDGEISGGAGGGGFYGGSSGTSGGCYGGGGGGSGYIGNPLLTNKVMYCYNCEESTEENTKTISTTCSEETPTENCAKKGNGYARITLVNIEE